MHHIPLLLGNWLVLHPTFNMSHEIVSLLLTPFTTPQRWENPTTIVINLGLKPFKVEKNTKGVVDLL
jgi:hypothetical protein